VDADDRKVLGEVLAAFLLIVKLLRFLIGRKKKKKAKKA
jgi:hypothetical protein